MGGVLCESWTQPVNGRAGETEVGGRNAVADPEEPKRYGMRQGQQPDLGSAEHQVRPAAAHAWMPTCRTGEFEARHYSETLCGLPGQMEYEQENQIRMLCFKRKWSQQNERDPLDHQMRACCFS